MLDVVLGTDGDVDPFAGDLDLELLARFEVVREPAELGDELVEGVALFDVAVWFVARGVGP